MPWVRNDRSPTACAAATRRRQPRQGLGQRAVVRAHLAIGLAHLVEGLVERIVSEERIQRWGSSDAANSANARKDCDSGRISPGSPNRKCAARKHRSSDDSVTAACRSCYGPPWPQRSRPGAPALGRPARAASPRTHQRLDLNQDQRRNRLTAPAGQWTQLLVERREQKPCMIRWN
jgi:hypothetical protein